MKQGNAGMVTHGNTKFHKDRVMFMSHVRASTYHGLILTFAPDYLFDDSFSKPGSNTVKPDSIFWIYAEVFLKSG